MQHDQVATIYDLLAIWGGMVAIFVCAMVVLSYLGGPTAPKEKKET